MFRKTKILFKIVMATMAVYLCGCSLNDGQTTKNGNEKILVTEERRTEGSQEEEQILLENSEKGVLHFSLPGELSEENKGYELFLAGKEKVVIGEEFQEAYKKLELEVENQASIDEMIEMIQMTYLTGKFTESGHKLSEIQYGFLDCGGDGKEELILRFIGLDIYSYGDDSALTCVIRRNQDGLLTLCDESLSWARKSVDYDYHGFIYEYGSSGAGDHTARVSVLDSLGKKHDIDETHYVIGSWLPFWGKSFNDFWESESEATLEIQNHHIGGKDYYSYVIMDGADEKKCEQYLQHCRENGITFYTAEEIEKLIEEYYSTLGIPVEYFLQMEIQWNTLKLD